jgi:peroxiredoxin
MIYSNLEIWFPFLADYSLRNFKIKNGGSKPPSEPTFRGYTFLVFSLRRKGAPLCFRKACRYNYVLKVLEDPTAVIF